MLKNNNLQKSNRHPPDLISQLSCFSSSLVLLKLLSDAYHPNIVSRYTVDSFYLERSLSQASLSSKKIRGPWPIITFFLSISTLSLSPTN